MRRYQRIGSLAAVIVVSLGACTQPSPTVPATPTIVATPVSGLTIGGLPSSVAVGQSFQLTAMVTLPDGSQKQTQGAAWKSSDTAGATVSSTGLLTIVAAGIVVDVSATLEDLSATRRLVVPYRITGVVHESAPTADVPVVGARVEVRGGPDAGKSVTTDSSGSFTLDVQAAGFTLDVTREGYGAGSVVIGELPRDRHPEIVLLPDARRISTTFTGSLCPDLVFWRMGHKQPCVGAPLEARHAIAIHRSGPIDLAIRWQYHYDYSAERMWLDVRCGQDAVSQEYVNYESYPVARTFPGGATSLRIPVEAPTRCEFRVFAYASFKSDPVPSTDYQLEIEHPK